MIDWIEELLPEMAEENEDGREDALTLTAAGDAVPAAPHWNGGEAGDSGTQDGGSGGRTAEKREAVMGSGPRMERSKSGEAPEGRTVFAQPESLGRAANRQSVTAEKGGAVVGSGLGPEWSESRETAAEGVRANRELWKNGPVWTVRGAGPEIAGVQRMPAVEREARTEEVFQMARNGDPVLTGLERAARDGTADPALNGAERSVSVRAGLEGLYRQTVQGLRPAAPALPPEQAGRTAGAQKPGSAAPLTVDELDRAVRRDSRRYDGGMSIY